MLSSSSHATPSGPSNKPFCEPGTNNSFFSYVIVLWTCFALLCAQGFTKAPLDQILSSNHERISPYKNRSIPSIMLFMHLTSNLQLENFFVINIAVIQFYNQACGKLAILFFCSNRVLCACVWLYHTHFTS